MDYFNVVVTTFPGLECDSSIAVNAGSESFLFSKDEQRSCRFGTIFDRIIPLRDNSLCHHLLTLILFHGHYRNLDTTGSVFELFVAPWALKIKCTDYI